MADVLYYPVWIAPGRRKGGWAFGAPCNTPIEAYYALKQRMAEGATLGCVVEFKGGEKRPLAQFVQPPSARKIIDHWEDLWDATER